MPGCGKGLYGQNKGIQTGKEVIEESPRHAATWQEPEQWHMIRGVPSTGLLYRPGRKITIWKR